jgi:hypothetical protein
MGANKKILFASQKYLAKFGTIHRWQNNSLYQLFSLAVL